MFMQMIIWFCVNTRISEFRTSLCRMKYILVLIILLYIYMNHNYIKIDIIPKQHLMSKCSDVLYLIWHNPGNTVLKIKVLHVYTTRICFLDCIGLCISIQVQVLLIQSCSISDRFLIFISLLNSYRNNRNRNLLK